VAFVVHLLNSSYNVVEMFVRKLGKMFSTSCSDVIYESMSNKIGPYGSHGGTGCYTKNCKRRDKVEASIPAPTTYEEARAKLEAAMARNTTAPTRTAFNATSQEVAAAKLEKNATKSGQADLRRMIKESKKTFGENSAPALIHKYELQKAVNKADRDAFNYRSNVFLATSKVTTRDLRSIANFSDGKYTYDKETNTISDALERETYKVNEDGDLVHTKTDYAPTETTVAKSGTDEYDEIKTKLVNSVSNEVDSNISIRPTPTSEIFETVIGKGKKDKLYALKRVPGRDDTSEVWSSDNKRKLAIIKQNANGQIVETTFQDAKTSKTIIQNSPFVFLSLLKTGELEKRSELPPHL
jgi:hypothetical protein